STLGNWLRALTTSSRAGDSTKMSTKARRRAKFNHRSLTPTYELLFCLHSQRHIKHCREKFPRLSTGNAKTVSSNVASVWGKNRPKPNHSIADFSFK